MKREDNVQGYESLEKAEAEKYQLNYYSDDSVEDLRSKMEEIRLEDGRHLISSEVRVYILDSFLFSKKYSLKRLIEYYYLKEDMNNVASR